MTLTGALLVRARPLPGAQGARGPAAGKGSARVEPGGRWGSPMAWHQDHRRGVLCNACHTQRALSHQLSEARGWLPPEHLLGATLRGRHAACFSAPRVPLHQRPRAPGHGVLCLSPVPASLCPRDKGLACLSESDGGLSHLETRHLSGQHQPGPLPGLGCDSCVPPQGLGCGPRGCQLCDG